MNKMLTMLVLAASVVTGAYAWQISVTNSAAYPTMIAPPAVNYVGNRQIAARAPTNAVTKGDIRRYGDMVLIAANTGVTTSAVPTAVSWTTGGVYITANQLTVLATNGAVVVTNFVYNVGDITVPNTGLSGMDGTNVLNAVYWYRVPTSRQSIILQPVILESGKYMYYADADGNVVIEDDITEPVELRGFNGVLYGHSSGTSGVINVFQIQ